ncbi:MAG: hypothetical protein NW202_13480 [Nitrospira sp.]|nr:hypothetical protein [Nitrospira sp.]
MTANTTRTRELNIEVIVYLAGRTAGLLNSQQRPGTQAYSLLAADAMDYLELEVDALAVEGIMARHTDILSVTMVDGQATYSLASDTIEVFGYAMFVDGDVRTAVSPVLREAYHMLPDQSASGQPMLYYVDKQQTIQVKLWPVPASAEDGKTIEFQRHYLSGDNNDASKTPDLERYWAKYLVFAVAHHLMVASGRSPQDCGYVRSQADLMLRKSIGKSRQRPGTQIRVAHRTGWEGR